MKCSGVLGQTGKRLLDEQSCPTSREEHVAKKSKPEHIDPSWPEVDKGEHAVSEFCSDTAGAPSPFGPDVTLPLNDIPYVHPVTRINK